MQWESWGEMQAMKYSRQCNWTGTGKEQQQRQSTQSINQQLAPVALPTLGAHSLPK